MCNSTSISKWDYAKQAIHSTRMANASTARKGATHSKHLSSLRYAPLALRRRIALGALRLLPYLGTGVPPPSHLISITASTPPPVLAPQ